MAEPLVSNVVGRIGDLVTQEAKFLCGVERQVESLHKELRWMKSFLKEVDSRQAEDERLRQWVAEIRDIAYDAEDVVETFSLKIASKRRRRGIWNCLKRSACILKEGWMLHKVKSEIEEITEKINALTRRLQTYGIKDIRVDEGEGSRTSSSSIVRRQELRRPYPHIVETYVVGLDNNIKELVSVLVDDEDEGRRNCSGGRVFASICGMGGLGKTTLAKKVFHHSQVRNHFKVCIWAYVSQQFQRRRVWKGILSTLDLIDQGGLVDYLKWEDDQLLAEMLYNFLKENKCLLVLDDIWSSEDWEILRAAFPMEETGTKSKILITTRNKDVALHADSRGYLHELQCLSDEDSWKLFRHLTFARNSESEDYVIDENMEKLGKEMVKQCAGLPLAIVVLGGILGTKHSLSDWQIVHENVKSYLRRGRGWGTYEALTLSYDNLPAYLKPCFLYLSVFPEDYEIPVDRLIQLWVAEDIVTVTESDGNNGEEMAEDVAERCLNELVERYMVLVGKRDASLKIKTCRMHDLVRDFCWLKAKQENFICIVDRLEVEQADFNMSSSAIGTVRRLVMHDSLLMINRIKVPYLKSALFFKPDLNILEKEILEDRWFGKSLEFWLEKNADRDDCDVTCFLAYCLFMCRLKHRIQGLVRYICKKFKLLRVLHLEGVPLMVCKLQGDISNLIHLRFLSLGDDFDYWVLPSSVSKLRCLQTFYITTDVPTYVPNVFWRMEQLRHLYLPKDFCSRTKLKLDNLTNLQTLINFNSENCNLGDLSCMKKLRKLGINSFFVENFSEDLNLMNIPPIITSKHLCSLSISSHLSEQPVDPRHLNYLLSSCVNIYELDLSVEIRKLPQLQPISLNLAYMCLNGSKLDEDPLPTLEKLPKLRLLELKSDAFMGEVMVCSLEGFPELVSFSIISQPNFEELRVNQGAMSNLQDLMIASCMKLRMLPDELKFITTLKEVKMEEMPKAFKDKLVEGGEDHYKVQHVPSVIFQNCDK